jgi:CubicO group peptidase (beta-lactamase class C family)
MAHHHTPGLSIAVIHQDEIEWAQGYGVKEAGKPEPVTADTLFQAGSISKPVAAVAALRLVEAGRLDLDADVNCYLTSWRVPANQGWQPKVTLRQLLSHTGGLTVHGFPGYAQGQSTPTSVQVLNGEEPANTPPVRVDILPGVQHRYSGGGTTVVQQILMDLLGKPFPQIVRELVFEPVGMVHSTYEQPLPERYWPSAATAHPKNARPLEGRWHTYPEMAAAGLWTTASDLARFALELQRARAGRSNKVLSVETVKEMLTPQGEENVGLGVFLEGSGASLRFGHGGWDEGFVAKLTAYQDQGYGAVVMLNSNQGWPLMEEIVRAIATEYGWPGYLPSERVPAEIDPETFDAYAGEYELRPDFLLTITRQDDTLLVRAGVQEAIALYPETETKYFARVIEAEVAFLRDREGAVEALTLRQSGREIRARRRR